MAIPTGYLFKRAHGKHLPATSPERAIYYLSYEIGGKRSTVCLHTDDHAAAKKAAADHLAGADWGSREAYLKSMIALGKACERELFGHAQDQSITPANLWTRYLASRRRPDSGAVTLNYYKQHVSALVSWLPADAKTMRHVTLTLAENYVRALEGAMSAPTAAKHVATLRRVWRVVDPDGPQPWKDLRPIGQHIVVPYRRLTLDEVRRLAQAARATDQELYGLVLVGYYTALRLVDAVHISADNLDLARHELHLKAPQKTAKKKPAPLHIPMLPELEQWLICQTPQGGRIFPTLAHRYATQSLTRQLAKLFDAAQVPNTAKGTASFHSLRATFVSCMDDAGAPSRVTDMVTNHAPKTMHDRYSHPEMQTAREWMTKALPALAV